MGEPLRACPICPNCGSKRFTRLPGDKVTVKCRSCEKIIEI
jgi:DNA-directed RNA polymerase subunit RPC12/RpoP